MDYNRQALIHWSGSCGRRVFASFSWKGIRMDGNFCTSNDMIRHLHNSPMYHTSSWSCHLHSVVHTRQLPSVHNHPKSVSSPPMTWAAKDPGGICWIATLPWQTDLQTPCCFCKYDWNACQKKIWWSRGNIKCYSNEKAAYFFYFFPFLYW